MSSQFQSTTAAAEVKSIPTDLQHNWIDGGELGLFPIQIFYWAFQQENFGVLDIGVHLNIQKVLCFWSFCKNVYRRKISRWHCWGIPSCGQYSLYIQSHSLQSSQIFFLLESNEELNFKNQSIFLSIYLPVNKAAHLFDVDQLADVHVIITVANIRSNGLDNLSNHRDNNVPPRQRQRLAVEQLLQQRHHVAVICRAEWGTEHEKCSFRASSAGTHTSNHSMEGTTFKIWRKKYHYVLLCILIWKQDIKD